MSTVNPSLGMRRQSTPIRLTLANELGNDIDGAWWPRTDRIGVELPELILALRARLGDITNIAVNWPPLQRPPDLNWQGWQHKQQHVMTVTGADALANVLIVPYSTNGTLALMMLRRAPTCPSPPPTATRCLSRPQGRSSMRRASNARPPELRTGRAQVT